MNSMSAAQRFSVGLTGGIGSGKSLVADMLALRGAAIVDTDRIAHQLTAAGGTAIPAISAAFGAIVLTADGAMDRPKMRALAFADAGVRKRLESILHPLITAETERVAEEAKGAYLVYVVPLLVESGKWRQRVCRVLVVDCSEELQLTRVMARSGLSEAEVQAIMATQATRKARLAAADDVIVNEAGIASLEPQVDRLHRFYLSMAKIN